MISLDRDLRAPFSLRNENIVMHSELGNMNHYYSLCIMQLLSSDWAQLTSFFSSSFLFTLSTLRPNLFALVTLYICYLLFCSYLCNLLYSNKTRLSCVCILYRCVVVLFGKSIGRLKALDFTLYHSFMFCYNFGITCFFLLFSVPVQYPSVDE